MTRIACGDQRTQEINSRLQERNIASGPVDVVYSVPPKPTKYTKMQVFDSDFQNVDTQVKDVPIYNISKTFLPGNDKPHFSGFSTRIDNESQLRNQFFSLQKCDQRHYVPASNSDLYQVNVQKPKEEQINMSHNLLFNESRFNKHNPNIHNTGFLMFNNSTRVQRNDNIL